MDPDSVMQIGEIAVCGLIDKCKGIQAQQDTTLQFLCEIVGTEEEKWAIHDAHCAIDALAAVIDCIQSDANKIRRAVEEIKRAVTG